MAEAYPSQVSTFKVVGRLVKGVADSSDVDSAPDLIPLINAVITFTPNLNPPVFRIPTATTPVTIFQESIVATTDTDGYLKIASDLNRGVVLPYGFSPDITPNGWNWGVKISVGGNFPEKIFSINGSAGAILDLATLIPVPTVVGTQLVAWQDAVNNTMTNVTKTEVAAKSAADSLALITPMVEEVQINTTSTNLSATSASGSATAANTSKIAAANSATSAATSSTSSASSATTATSASTSASGSATSANTSKVEASTSATNSASSATSSATSAASALALSGVAALALDTDGVPYYSPAGNASLLIRLDTDGVPYYTPLTA